MVTVPATKETKLFYLTSEFWLHNILALILWLNSIKAWYYLPGVWGQRITAIMAVVLTSSYITSRGRAKSGVGYTSEPKK